MRSHHAEPERPAAHNYALTIDFTQPDKVQKILPNAPQASGTITPEYGVHSDLPWRGAIRRDGSPSGTGISAADRGSSVAIAAVGP